MNGTVFTERSFAGKDFPPLENAFFRHCEFRECRFLVCRKCFFTDCRFTSCDLELFIDTLVNGCIFKDTSLPIIGEDSMASNNVIRGGEITVPSAAFDYIDSLMRYFDIISPSMGAPIIDSNSIDNTEPALT